MYAAPINWWRLDAEERVETMTVLTEWVPELVRRYGLQDAIIPPCWFRHEAMIQELLALFQYRNQLQFLPAAPPGAPLDFHYQLQLVMQRMRSWTGMTGCNGGEHEPTRVQSWADPQMVNGAKWATAISDYLLEQEQVWKSEEGTE